MNPAEALDYAIEFAMLRDIRREPGAAIAKLPRDVRQSLEQLTSDEARNVRLPEVYRRGLVQG